jgi:IS4 transposase
MALMLKDQATSIKVNLYGKKREVQVFSKKVMLKTLKCEVHVVLVFRKTQWIALYSTELSLSVTQIVEYYGARWKIESGFKEIKQDIGSSKSQNRNAHSVVNHLNFALMATTITWIYGAKMENAPNRRHHVKGRNSFAFSDLRHLIAKDSLNENFKLV